MCFTAGTMPTNWLPSVLNYELLTFAAIANLQSYLTMKFCLYRNLETTYRQEKQSLPWRSGGAFWAFHILIGFIETFSEVFKENCGTLKEIVDTQLIGFEFWIYIYKSVSVWRVYGFLFLFFWFSIESDEWINIHFHDFPI